MQRAVNEEINNKVQKCTAIERDSRPWHYYALGGNEHKWCRYVYPYWESRIRGANSDLLVSFNHFKQEQLLLTTEKLILQRLGPSIAFLVVCFV